MFFVLFLDIYNTMANGCPAITTTCARWNCIWYNNWVNKLTNWWYCPLKSWTWNWNMAKNWWSSMRNWHHVCNLILGCRKFREREKLMFWKLLRRKGHIKVMFFLIIITKIMMKVSFAVVRDIILRLHFAGFSVNLNYQFHCKYLIIKAIIWQKKCNNTKSVNMT